MRWGKDNEERAACAQKAQDAYAAARQAQARVDAAEGAVTALRADLVNARETVAQMQRTVATLALRIDELELARAPKPRKAA